MSQEKKKLKFASFQLSERTLEFVGRNGFTETSEIQALSLAPILQGKNVMVRARTGSGKTHAFLVPIMERLQADKAQIQAAVVLPTNELARQIYQRALVMTEIDPQLQVRLMLGQQEEERGQWPHLLITTWGKIIELFVERGVWPLQDLQMLVFDEVDMLLESEDAWYLPQLLEKLPKTQILTFSATLDQGLQNTLKKMVPRLTLIGGELQNHRISHQFINCQVEGYYQALKQLLGEFVPNICMVFVRNKEEISKVSAVFHDLSLKHVVLSSAVSQRERKNIFRDLASCKISYIITTDLLARGIDNGHISHVISVGTPSDYRYYLHRSGRSARFEQSGVSYLLFTDSERGMVEKLQKVLPQVQYYRWRRGKLQPIVVRQSSSRNWKEVQIARSLTRKKRTVKPNHKKKFAAAVAQEKQRQRREIIRQEISRQKQERYRRRSVLMESS